ncbi:MAG: glycosyltransferase [Anaerolineae bacterium]|nr:glycosyltransferase [Anaerolineae bacterium]
MLSYSPKVSIVVGTYNQQAFIRETVESILNQTYPHIEIIFADDGSTDDTPRILQEYAARFPNKIKLALGEKNIGIPGNINRALALRTGELTAWLDGDDLMLPQKIEKQVRLLQNHPEAIGCYHDAEVFESTTGQVLGSLCKLYNGSSKLRQGKIQNCLKPRYFSIPSSFMSYSSACPLHGFDERLKYLSELLFFIEVFRNGDLLAIDEPLVRYRRHSQNVTDDQAAKKLFHEYELIVYSILEARYPELYPLVKKLRIGCLLTEAVKWYRQGDYKRFRLLIRNTMRQGGFFQGLTVFLGLSIFGKYISKLLSGQPYSRPNWIKKLSQQLLR